VTWLRKQTYLPLSPKKRAVNAYILSNNSFYSIRQLFRVMEMVSQDRYQRGWEKLKEIDGEAGERVVDNLKDIAPDKGRGLFTDFAKNRLRIKFSYNLQPCHKGSRFEVPVASPRQSLCFFISTNDEIIRKNLNSRLRIDVQERRHD